MLIKFKAGIPKINELWKGVGCWMDDNAEVGMSLTRFDATQIRLYCPEPAETLESLLENEVFDPAEIDYEVIL